MFVFDTSSWHYRLVLYVFGNSFFFDEEIDSQKIRKELLIIEDKTRKKFPNNDDALEKAHHDFQMRVFHEDKFLSYTKNKNINFCPYCRAVVTSLIVFPFCVLYKLIPKKEPREYNYEESKKRMDKRSKIIRGACAALNIGLGIKNIVLDNSIEIGLIQIGIGISLFFLSQTVTVFRKIYNSIYFCYKKGKKLLIALNILKEVKKEKIPETKESKTPNFIQAFFSENHNKYCPPVRFVDDNKNEEFGV